jgi:hypothetical protein
VDQDSVAEIQFRLRLIVLLLMMLGNIFIVPEVVNLMDSQGAEIAEELPAFDVDEADPVEFSAARLQVCCPVKFGSGWSGVPSRIRGARLGAMTVLVVGRHVALR